MGEDIPWGGADPVGEDIPGGGDIAGGGNIAGGGESPLDTHDAMTMIYRELKNILFLKSRNTTN